MAQVRWRWICNSQWKHGTSFSTQLAHSYLSRNVLSQIVSTIKHSMKSLQTKSEYCTCALKKLSFSCAKHNAAGNKILLEDKLLSYAGEISSLLQHSSLGFLIHILLREPPLRCPRAPGNLQGLPEQPTGFFQISCVLGTNIFVQASFTLFWQSVE